MDNHQYAPCVRGHPPFATNELKSVLIYDKMGGGGGGEGRKKWLGDWGESHVYAVSWRKNNLPRLPGLFVAMDGLVDATDVVAGCSWLDDTLTAGVGGGGGGS